MRILLKGRPKCRLSLRAYVCFASTQSPMRTGAPSMTRTNQVEGSPDDIRWMVTKEEFDDILAKKRICSWPRRHPYSVYRCAGGIGTQFLFNAYRFVADAGAVPPRFAASRTVFIPKTSTVDDNGRIVRSPDALRPLTLCNCDCKIFTTATCHGLHQYSTRCIHQAQRCVSTRQMTDNIFEIETAALAHHACETRDPGILLTDFACAYSSVNHS